MENHPAARPATSQRSLASRAGWAILIVATLYVCYFSHLGAIGFVGPDEPRYAWIARDMAETGDWVTPRLYGKPWFEKPPLFYWGAALSFKLFGVSEAAARLPSAVSALLATLALAWLAWRMYGVETARWLLLLLPTTVGMIGFSHAAATDMPFSAMLTIAMVFAAVVFGLTKTKATGALHTDSGQSSPASLNPPTPWPALLLFGFFLGLAVLAKGPAAIVLGGGAVLFWALLTKRWRDAFRLLHPAGVAAFCATALPWYILCARRNPDFFRIFFIEHNFKRYLTPEFQHTQPFWYYLPILLLALLPWTAIPLWSLISNQSRKSDPSTLLFFMFTAFCLLFFSLSKSKLPGYILPAVPALGFTTSVSIGPAWSSRRKSLYFSLYGAWLLLFALGILISHARISLRGTNPGQQQGIGTLGLLVSISSVSLACGLSTTRPTWAPKAGLAFAVLWIVVPLCVADRYLALLDRDNSPRFLSERIISRGLATEVRTLGVDRSWVYGLNFYLRREVPEWDESVPMDSYVVTSLEAFAELKKNGWLVQIVDFGRSGKLRQNLSLYRVSVDKANASTR